MDSDSDFDDFVITKHAPSVGRKEATTAQRPRRTASMQKAPAAAGLQHGDNLSEDENGKEEEAIRKAIQLSLSDTQGSQQTDDNQPNDENQPSPVEETTTKTTEEPVKQAISKPACSLTLTDAFMDVDEPKNEQGADKLTFIDEEIKQTTKKKKEPIKRSKNKVEKAADVSKDMTEQEKMDWQMAVQIASNESNEDGSRRRSGRASRGKVAPVFDLEAYLAEVEDGGEETKTASDLESNTMGETEQPAAPSKRKRNDELPKNSKKQSKKQSKANKKQIEDEEFEEQPDNKQTIIEKEDSEEEEEETIVNEEEEELIIADIATIKSTFTNKKAQVKKPTTSKTADTASTLASNTNTKVKTAKVASPPTPVSAVKSPGLRKPMASNTGSHAMSSINSPRTPIRVGLSRRQPAKTLHRYLQQ
ncbi:hypothetical protein BDF19DRAFT_437833 [Syncephalis fuscata]|nr:hypothetical protein BDF19DRAFT_437833 [Syncephalis fuscata]